MGDGLAYCYAYVDTVRHGNQYVRFSRDDTLDEGFTRTFSTAWKGSPKALRWLAEAESSGRTVPSLYLPRTGKVYFLHGDTYIRCTLETHTVDEGFPKTIGSYWPGLRAAGFDSGIDAALWWDEKKVYFFKGDQYVRYDLETDRVDDGYPKSIGSYWPGSGEAGFAGGIDAFVRWDAEWAYAFKNDRYIRFHIPTDRVDQSPRRTTDYWQAYARATARRVLSMWSAPAVPIPPPATGTDTGGKEATAPGLSSGQALGSLSGPQGGDGELRVTGAAVTGTGSSRTAHLILEGCWVQVHRKDAGRWSAVLRGRQPLNKVFPEVTRRFPVGEAARVNRMFHAGTTGADAGSWLSFGRASADGLRHIGYHTDTRDTHTRPPHWWPEDGGSSVIGAAALADGSVLYAAGDEVRVYTPGAPGRRVIGATPVGTTALCYDPDTGDVYFFTSPTTLHTAKLTGSRLGDYALAPPVAGKITAVWPDHGAT